jgi:ATP adenylyltransferase
MTTCPLCQGIETGAISFRDERIPGAVLYRSEHLIVMPTLGPLAEGHVMICPADHYPAIAAMPAGWYSELERAQAWVEDRFGQHYPEPVTYFEHGMAAVAGRGGCCIDHAHLHAVATSADFFPARRVRRWDEVHDWQARTQMPYVYYQRGAERLLLEADGPVPSQWLRRRLGHALGEPWDWRTHPGLDRLRALIDKLGDYSDKSSAI